MDWSGIAAEVEEAIGEVGFSATLEKKTTTGPAYDPTITATSHQITVIDDAQRVRDADGTLVGQTMRTLTVATGSATPAKGDRVQVLGEWREIAEVRPLAPGGVALLWEVDLAG